MIREGILLYFFSHYPVDLIEKLYSEWRYAGYIKASKNNIFHQIMRDNFVDDYIEEQLRKFLSKEKQDD
jgi:hypothetical protein